MKPWIYLALSLQSTLYFVPSSDSCNLAIIATSVASNLTSPGYPLDYPTNADCWWTIKSSSADKSIGVKVVDLNLEHETNCIYDSLSFYDGDDSSFSLLARMCGSHKWPVISTGNSMFIRLKSDDSRSDSGFFLMVFEVGRCGGDLTATSDINSFTSPGYPYTYFNNMSCTWFITAENENDTISITTNKLQVLSAKLFYDFCTKDAVVFYNGNTTEDTDLLGAYCGEASPYLQSSNNVMRIEFVTDGSGTSNGFSLSYSSKTAGDCNTTTVISTQPSFIASPGYPDTYYNDLNCNITILSSQPLVMLDILSLDIEGPYPDCDNDSLTVYSDLDQQQEMTTLCGNATVGPTVLYSNTSWMSLRFKTNSDIVGRGFYLRVQGLYTRVVPTTPPDCGSRYLTANSTPQYLQSPSYPQHYYNNEQCVWKIRAAHTDMMVRIVIIDAVLEMSPSTSCNYDYVTVHDGSSVYAYQIAKWCDKRQPVIQSSGQSMTLKFHTDGSTTQRGFKLMYFETSEPNLCGGTINATLTPYHLTSPNYPGIYLSNLDCRWTIFSPDGEHIKISTTNIYIESSSSCAFDYLEIYDGTESTSSDVGKLCGDEDATFLSSGSSVTVIFHSDNSNSFIGFDLKVQAGHYSACTGGTVNLYTTYSNKDLLSPNYPFEYPSNADCTWLIHSGGSDYIVKIDVVTSHLEYSAGCTNDYVEAYDGQDGSSSSLGRWCGTDVPIKKSTGRYMFLKFKSDNSVTHSSFKIHYAKEFDFTFSSDYNDYGVSAGVIAGCTIGGIVLAIIAVIIISNIISRSRRQRPVVTRVPNASLYTVSTGALETTVTPAPPATFTPPPSYTAATMGTETNGGPPPYSVTYTNKM